MHGRGGGHAQGVALAAPCGHARAEDGALGVVQLDLGLGEHRYSG
ncbi:hypothetical protein [Streptomyces sp. NPDC020817]